ncbi:dynein light chain Tctex-type 5-B-like isoform X1 [Anguilla rostrata]|uniref:dynein light chain Tctex-type 5-B-like isoform X1 n=2 Tax=Anguilla rostrata TaxID=7938 RepID=UPI0030CED04F
MLCGLNLSAQFVVEIPVEAFHIQPFHLRMDKSNGGKHSWGSRMTMNFPDKLTLERNSTAVKEVPVAVPQLGHRLPNPPQGQPQEGIAISLKGLLAAQRFSKGLKKRATLKLAAKKGIGTTPLKPVKIINEQVPDGFVQPLERFPVAQVTKLLQGFLASRLDGVTYEASRSGQLVQDLSEDVKRLVRAVCPSHYKLICILTLGQVEREGVMLASRCLWDPHSDTFASHTYKSPLVFCTAVIFAVYCE